MPRKLRSAEPQEWFNPLKDVHPRPYLADDIWPRDPRTEAWAKQAEVLKSFYCDKRERGEEDLEVLETYLRNPEGNMILWGDVGIGKSWFIRFELLAGRSGMAVLPYHAGIIDMLTGLDTGHAVYTQLGLILEMYFERFCGDTHEALSVYARFDLARLRRKKDAELTPAERNDAAFTASRWLDLRSSGSKQAAMSYVDRLLAALECVPQSELLILVVDNIDKTTDDEQERLAKLAVRLLGHPKTRLIIPLRKSSRLVMDRFSVLKEFPCKEMELHPLNLREMLRLRFCRSKGGQSLHGSPIIKDLSDRSEYTFPRLFETLFGHDEKDVSDAGDLVLTLASGNAREALQLTERLIYSDQLKGLRHIGAGEYAVAALMLTDTSKPDAPAPCVLDLFNNEEPSAAGNALIRFRVLEYFWNAGNATPADVSFKKYFERLGYSTSRVKRVLHLFMMTQLLVSEEGLSPDNVRARPFDEIGSLAITPAGKKLRALLDRMWYFVSVKRDVYLPAQYIHEEGSREYCKHTEFVEWLLGEERKEDERIRRFVKKNGPQALGWGLIRPHRLAEAALGLRENRGE
ncbi:MAG: hypothetical protein JW753_11640 [Dehalococcoidia bacterium]|nr:hypothetical protein [Dehalococcoidia bacterium]